MLLSRREVSLTIYNFWYSEHIGHDEKKLRKRREGGEKGSVLTGFSSVG